MAEQTEIPEASNVVVVVGGPDVLVQATRSAAGIAVAARVEEATLQSAATAVSTHRPLAIVIGNHIYGFDGAEFDALARDVGAALIHIDAMDADRFQLERQLMPMLGQIARDRG